MTARCKAIHGLPQTRYAQKQRRNGENYGEAVLFQRVFQCPAGMVKPMQRVGIILVRHMPVIQKIIIHGLPQTRYAEKQRRNGENYETAHRKAGKKMAGKNGAFPEDTPADQVLIFNLLSAILPPSGIPFSVS